MPTLAQRWLLLRVLIGTLWSAVLLVAGLRLITSELTAGHLAWRAAGIGLAALGMYVFSCVVADRVFPRADLRICGSVQFLLVMVLLPCLGFAAWTFIRTWAAGI